MPLFGTEIETVATILTAVIGSLLAGYAAAYVTIKKANSEEGRKDKEQEEKSLLIVVQQQTTIISDLKSEFDRQRTRWDNERIEIIKRLDAKDNEVKKCHENEVNMYRLIARMEGALTNAGIKFKPEEGTGEHKALRETLPESSDMTGYDT